MSYQMVPASMPTISPKRDIQRCFENARRLSAGSHGNRWLVIIAPDGTLVNVPVPKPNDADQSLLRDVSAMLAPEHEPVTGLTVTSINCTLGVRKRARSFDDMVALVPNLSHLIGAVALGNNVVAFEGHPGDLKAGCVGADLLLIDDGMIPFLQQDWGAVAVESLRQPRVLLFGRDGKLSKLDKVVAVEQPD